MSERITAVSLRRLLDFESCPHRLFLEVLRKAPKPEYDTKHPLIRGQIVHKELEQYIRGHTDLPESGKRIKDHLELCREYAAEGKARPEEQWGFDSDWQITGYWDDNIWLRMATDCYVLPAPDAGIIYDWKTGKSFGNEVKYMQQMQLYACGALMRHPDLEIVDVHLVFTDDGVVRSRSFERGPKFNALIARFTERFNRITECIDWRPKPNVMNCKFCPFGPGGTNVCIYGVKPL